MIERENTNELQGQYTLDDLLPGNGGNQNVQPMEGYDAEGNLLNEDWPPLQKPSPVGGPQALASLRASGVTAQAVTDEVLDAETQTNDGTEAGVPGTSSDHAGTTQAFSDAPTFPTGGRLEEPQTPADDEARLSALATEINAITEQTRGVVISAALAVGKRLIEARSLCQEGRWLEWLSKSVAYSERKAQDMMRLYVEYGRDGSIPDSIAALDYSKAVALLSAPADQREALAERAAGEDLSVRELQGEIKKLKAEKLKAQMQIEGLEQQVDTAQGHIEKLTDEGNRQDQAIVGRDREIEAKEAELRETKRVLADAAEKVTVAQAKATAAESAAEQLKRLRAEAEERADQNAQRYGDALKRANETAKQLAEAKARIQALSEAAAAGAPEPERVEVEVVPEAVQREIEQLKRDLAEARAVGGTTSSDPAKAGPPSPKGEGSEVSAAEKFKWFYQNQMQPTFKTALTLLQEVAREDGHAADAFATAMTNACRVLMNQLGVSE